MRPSSSHVHCLRLLCLLPMLLVMSAIQAQMVTAGQFQVSESGAATYTIALRVPPGVAGVEPNLSLNYSSQSGNGLLGVGWSLGGLGAVSRCPRTQAQDGVRGGVAYDANDRFCLDGQRLIAINGADGENGTEYRTERESFAKVVSYGSAGSGPAWFKVWTKSGQVIEYGNTDDARVEAQGKSTVRVWALNRLEDTVGNYLLVSYGEDTDHGDYYPIRIDYTGNRDKNTVPVNSVHFLYEERSDIVPLYQAGSMIKSRVRLRALEVHTGENAAAPKLYNLRYTTDGAANRSKIVSISECIGDDCLAVLEFDWESERVSFDERQRVDTQFTPSSGWFTTQIHNRVWIVDVNGDGLPDILGATDGGLYWQLNTANGFGPAQRVDTIFTPSSSWFATNIHNRVWIADVNGDGLPDILGATDGGLHWQLNTGNGFDPAQRVDTIFTPSSSWFATNIHNRVWIVDVNGDGLPDILGATDGGLYWQLNTANGFGPAQRADTIFTPSSSWFATNIHNRVWIVDVNGDGLPDILGATDGGLYWQLNTANGFGPAQRADTIFTPSSSWFATNIHNRVWIVDVNGDGLPDILGATDGGLYWQLNTGNGFGPAQRVDTQFTPSSGWFTTQIHNRVWIADVNGDGLPDILGATSSGLYLQLNTGNGFGTNQRVDTVFNPDHGWFATNIHERVWLADVGGNGLSSILGATDTGLYWQRNVASLTARPHLITTVREGTGAVTNIAYGALTDAALYQKDSSVASFPVQNLQVPMYVVSSVISPNGKGGTTTTSYIYGGLKTEVGSGRGLLGFRWIQARQAETAIASYTEYLQSWPYTGLPSVVRKSLSSVGNNGIFSQITNSYRCDDAASIIATACEVGSGRRYFVYVRDTRESSWDANGAALPEITTKTEYDHWGNATKVEVSTSDGYGKSTVNTYANDSDNWHLGRLLKSSVTSTTP